MHTVHGATAVRRRLNDLVGSDIGMHVGQNFYKDFRERVYPTKLIQMLNDANRLGEKTGSGFYKFDAKRKALPDPDLAPIIQKSRQVGPARLQHTAINCVQIGSPADCRKPAARLGLKRGSDLRTTSDDAILAVFAMWMLTHGDLLCRLRG